MFTAALFTIAKTQKQPRSPSEGELKQNEKTKNWYIRQWNIIV